LFHAANTTRAVEPASTKGGFSCQWCRLRYRRTIPAHDHGYLGPGLPYVETWFMAPSICFVATREPLAHDTGVLRHARRKNPSQRHARGRSTTRLGRCARPPLAAPSLVAELPSKGARINTDDRAPRSSSDLHVLCPARVRFRVRDVARPKRAHAMNIAPGSPVGHRQCPSCRRESGVRCVSGLTPSVPAG